MKLMPYVYGWVVLALIVMGFAIRRGMVGRQDDETVHLADREAGMIARQTMVERKLRTIDRWGKLLTVIAVVYGLALLGFYIYGVWLAGTKPPA